MNEDADLPLGIFTKVVITAIKGLIVKSTE